jgi:hypothetical protein
MTYTNGDAPSPVRRSQRAADFKVPGTYDGYYFEYNKGRHPW